MFFKQTVNRKAMSVKHCINVYPISSWRRHLTKRYNILCHKVYKPSTKLKTLLSEWWQTFCKFIVEIFPLYSQLLFVYRYQFTRPRVPLLMIIHVTYISVANHVGSKTVPRGTDPTACRHVHCMMSCLCGVTLLHVVCAREALLHSECSGAVIMFTILGCMVIIIIIVVFIVIRVRTIVWKSDSPIVDSIGENNWPMR